jgi:hypothetical protein
MQALRQVVDEWAEADALHDATDVDLSPADVLILAGHPSST